MASGFKPVLGGDTRFTYYVDADTFVETKEACRCPEEVWGLFAREEQCQGVLGHAGDHWFYNVRGNLERCNAKMSSSTPPYHKSYVSPVEKLAECYATCDVRRDITDQAEIAALKAEIGPDFEASGRVSVVRSLTIDELSDDARAAHSRLSEPEEA